MKVLVLNCGSSSVKYQFFDMSNNAEVLAKGLVERVCMCDGVIKHQAKEKLAYKAVLPVPDHTVAINLIIEALLNPEYGVIKDKNEIGAVGHRVVHGGEKFSGSVKITKEIIDKMEECVELAPLHNPANLKGIYAIQKLLPEIEQCGVFDTAFHFTMPEYAYMYGISYKMYEKYRVRRYGFHGTSHRYVSKKACEFLGIDYYNSKVITCHLGNGASIAAIKNGESIDTSMGLTPVEGLLMGTRCGDFDLGALLFIMDKENMDIKRANAYINKECGVQGISDISSDMRDLHQALEEGNHRAKLALEMYAYRVKKYIGAYAAAMGGVDAIVFTGGIGENDYWIRAESIRGLEFLGIDFDYDKNDGIKSKDAILTRDNSRTKVLTLGTDEELVIALDTMEIINSKAEIV